MPVRKKEAKLLEKEAEAPVIDGRRLSPESGVEKS
jgi:hypothetical protein